MIGVSVRTAANLVDSHRLPGYKLPGSDHRRIPPAGLLAFAKQHGIPLDVADLHNRAKIGV